MDEQQVRKIVMDQSEREFLKGILSELVVEFKTCEPEFKVGLVRVILEVNDRIQSLGRNLDTH